MAESRQKGIVAYWLCWVLLAACGGSEGVVSGKSPGDPDRVTFEESQTRTVFSDGSAAFTVSPPLGPFEQAVCAVNDVTASSCMTDADFRSDPVRGFTGGRA